MDKRAKAFVAEAGSRLGRIAGTAGFAGPEVDGKPNEYPLLLTVRYRRAAATVETRLVIAYGGDQYVETRLLLGDDQPAIEVGRDTARTVSEMRRALDRQAAAVRTTLGEPQPSA